MADAARLVAQMEQRRAAELDRLADLAMRDSDYRVYQATHVPIKRRGRRVHRIQKLSLITLAAQRKYLRRQVVEMVDQGFRSVDFLEADVQDLVCIKNILLKSHDFRGTFQVGGDECTQLSQ